MLRFCGSCSWHRAPVVNKVYHQAHRIIIIAPCLCSAFKTNRLCATSEVCLRFCDAKEMNKKLKINNWIECFVGWTVLRIIFIDKFRSKSHPELDFILQIIYARPSRVRWNSEWRWVKDTENLLSFLDSKCQIHRRPKNLINFLCVSILTTVLIEANKKIFSKRNKTFRIVVSIE